MLYMSEPVVEWLHAIFENQGVVVIEESEKHVSQTKGGGFYFDKEATESAWEEAPWRKLAREETSTSFQKKKALGNGLGTTASGGGQILCPDDVPDTGASSNPDPKTCTPGPDGESNMML